jgi:hypothetical protein
MVSRRKWSRIGSVLLLLAAGTGAAGCQGKPSSQPSPPANPSTPAATGPYSTSFSATGWTYHLRPIKPDARTDEDKARAVRKDLFPGMARDVKTRDLLKHLYADRPVEFRVLDAKQAEGKALLTAPPPEGFAVAMRVGDIKQEEKPSKVGTVPIRVIGYGRAILIKDKANPDSFEALAENMKREPSPGESLGLAMEDYLLRHAPGWAIIGGPINENEKLPASVEEQRRDLDRRIKDHADHAAAFYGSRRKR